MHIGLRLTPLGYNTRFPSSKLTLKLGKKTLLRYIRAKKSLLKAMITMPPKTQIQKQNDHANRINLHGITISKNPCSCCFKKGLTYKVGPSSYYYSKYNRLNISPYVIEALSMA